MTVRARESLGLAGFITAGALAGALSAVCFTAVHQLLISSIWFALPAMLIAGALCGVCLTWSYALAVPTPTVQSWLLYNALYLAMFVGLGLVSLVAFTPITTIAALLQLKAPPRALIGQALPVTWLSILAASVVLSLIYRPGWRGVGGLFVTTAVLVFVLGLNISMLGLVAVPRSEAGVLAEVFALLLGLSGVYAAAVVALSRARFRPVDSA